MSGVEAMIMALMCCALCMTSVYLGAYLGQKFRDGEKIEPPHPVKQIKEHREKVAAEREHDKEQSRMDAIMRNIEAYDGTTKGQEDVE